ncbi:tigger transposable element-derived protein 4 isoform X1 [Diabrotica virgifera virgifera]|uniref:Tigger transposable element-derived protein 4 isoform X1 n=1 Tax=Diabrotica virgifera virgifera TaxID=50390 RepID=A0A6P7FEW9_DIAVI|nr:tigger transposable element-derived protein 4 isoform X1 [Diabrotica virgifera virgifera]
MTTKRKAFTLEEKINILKDVENGKKKAEVCREKGISSSTLSTMLKSKDKIFEAGSTFSGKSKKLRAATNKELDTAMVTWLSLNSAADVPITGPQLQETATQISQALGGNGNFKASSGWLSRFKARHEITCGKICGEAKSVSKEVNDNWLNSWPTIRQNYSDDNIFNADELGLFFKLTPDKTVKFKNERCIDGKLSKERVTVLACANMSGSEKRKLLVIGKSQNPRCFKSVNQLPVTYKFNKKSWMTADIFSEELFKWDRELGHRKILLIVDNSTAHPKVNGLKNIELLFLPPNCPSDLQPMNQGIIRSLKLHYRKLLVKRILNNVENCSESPVTLLDAINFIHKAWSLIEKQTIRKCFGYAGWTETKVEHEEDEYSFAEWLRLQQQGQGELTQLNNDDEFAEFIAIDDDVIVCDLPPDSENVAEVIKEELVTDSDESDEDEGENRGEPTQEVPNRQDVESALNVVRNFIQAQHANEEVYDCFTSLENMVDRMILNNLKQSKMTDFFQLQQQ